MVTTLIGIDCGLQARNQMKGMMFNGATQAEVTMVRDVVLLLAERLGVKFKSGAIPVPDMPQL